MVSKRTHTYLDQQRPSNVILEILTHVLSHLHPDSHASVALVSKRFYSLVTTPHAWRMAFLRYFPGHESLDQKTLRASHNIWTDPDTDAVRSETRYFGRLTPLATWRSEYLFRTRLLRNLTRGKPGTSSGNIGSSVRSSQSGKKVSAVLTYNSKLPWLVTHVHAVFNNGKKAPRAIQGASDLGVATLSDPTSGKIEKWGLEDAFTLAQLDEVVPDLIPYGLGDGPAATPNVMDVSQPYGMLAGEGFPGGRAYFRGVSEMRGRYLGAESGVVDTYSEIPKIPEMSEAVTSVWLAKSSAVLAMTQSMVGMLTGSNIGVVTAYALGWDPSGPRYSNGDMTARWILSPGVPIVSLKVDENYSLKRRSASRVWAVALNALGEIYYLTSTPSGPIERKGEDMTKNAWFTGRSVYWHLLEATRRTARPDELDKNVLKGAYSPRSPSKFMKLSKEQLTAEAREIEKFLRHKPAHFRKVCEGWDMQRRLEVDFAADDGNGAGENIFVFECGLIEDQPACIKRYARAISSLQTGAVEEIKASTDQVASLFGSGIQDSGSKENISKLGKPASPPSTPLTPSEPASPMHDWRISTMNLKGHGQAVISATALDCTAHSLLTLAEDPLHEMNELVMAAAAPGPVEQGSGEVPGRRARYLVAGTKTGAVLVWNSRGEDDSNSMLSPLREIQTESPEISCVASTSLYLVHGGSDGLVQAWDPLASTLDPIRTLNARSNGRVPRHMMTMNPALRDSNYCAVGSIHLDADPTVLRGVVSFGAFMRYWAYSSTGHPTGRKRRHRHSDVPGRAATRRIGGAVTGFIAAEEAELRRENEQKAREQTRLRKRFGLGALGDLTEVEALRYAQMVSEEAYLLDEQRRTSDSAADAGLDTASSFSETTADAETPEPSLSGHETHPSVLTEDEDEYEQQIQQAIRLSLIEGVNDIGQSPRGSNSGDYNIAIKFKPRPRKTRSSGSSSPLASQTPINGPKAISSIHHATPGVDDDEDLALALSLSLQTQETDYQGVIYGAGDEEEHFPSLDGGYAAKGKGVDRW